MALLVVRLPGPPPTGRDPVEPITGIAAVRVGHSPRQERPPDRQQVPPVVGDRLDREGQV
jgi:hypothetical protein